MILPEYDGDRDRQNSIIYGVIIYGVGYGGN